LTSDIGELPLGWASCSIEELIGRDGLFVDGDWVESKDQDPNGEVRLIQLADIGDGEFRNKSSRFLTKPTAIQLKCTFLKVGDLLVARMPDPLGRSCIFPLDGDERYVTVVDVCAIRLGCSEIDAKFLMYLVNSPSIRAEINSLQSGSTRKRISRKNLATVKLPLPPLNEQNRIVAKIETMFSELDKGIEALKTARQQLEVYRQAVLKHAFEGKRTARWRQENRDKLESTEILLARIQEERQARYQEQLRDWQIALKFWEANGKAGKKPTKPSKPVYTKVSELSELPTLPSGWIWLEYGGLCERIRNGISAKPEGEDGDKIFRISAVRPMDFALDDVRYIDNSDHRFDDYRLKYGDLVFTRYNGSRAYVGVCAEYDGDGSHLFPDKLIQTRLGVASIHPSYLEKALNCGESRRFVEQRIRTTAGQSGVSGSDVKAIPVPICSLDEQHQIVKFLAAELSRSDKMMEEIEFSLMKSEALRQSVLKKAFSGRLVSQDPNDEPAAVLLGRLRAEKARQQKPGKASRRVRRV
tara:strand:+ start:8784 stop:10364 length:1581 start_codon:yes stop_codon:yes gene_type:complete